MSSNNKTFKKLLGSLFALVLAGQASADALNYGDVVQVANRDGSVFSPTPVAGDANGLYTGVSFSVDGNARSASSGLYVMDYSFDLNASATDWVQFLSFCLEPNVSLTSFSNPYTVMTLGSAGYDSGAISELWGRYRHSVVSDVTAAAFQIALWELAYDNGNNIAAGSFVLNGPASAPYLLANSWLSSLDGTGPRAYNLAVLVDNPNDRYNRQDLIVEIPVPATAALFGLGLFGVSLLRRRQAGN